MKIHLVAFVLGILIVNMVLGQNITGQWIGVLNVQGTQLRIVFNISKTENGHPDLIRFPD
jgi:uncharacterized protein